MLIQISQGEFRADLVMEGIGVLLLGLAFMDMKKTFRFRIAERADVQMRTEINAFLTDDFIECLFGAPADEQLLCVGLRIDEALLFVG